MTTHPHKYLSGFTLLEMIVSLAIFSIVAVVAVGSLARIVGLNRQAQTLQASMNNIDFALESMSREMRVGGDYNCTNTLTGFIWNSESWQAVGPGRNVFQCPIVEPPSNPSGDTFLSFLSAKTAPDGLGGLCRLIYIYKFTPAVPYWSMQKAQQTSCNQNISNSFSPLLDDTNVHVTSFRLGVYGAPPIFSIGFVRLIGFAGVREQDKNYFDIETDFTQRINNVI